MSQFSGFMSFNFLDNEHVGNAIGDLGRDLESAIEYETGAKFQIFLGTKHLNWGDDWKRKLTDALGSSMLFVPVITPRYFNSHGDLGCRAELALAIEMENSIGCELIFPIIFKKTASLFSDYESDPLKKYIKGRQWLEWNDFKYDNRASRLKALSEHAVTVAAKIGAIRAAREKAQSIKCNDAAEDTSDVVDQKVDELVAAMKRVLHAELPVDLYEIGSIFSVEYSKFGTVQIAFLGVNGPDCARELASMVELRKEVSKISWVKECFVYMKTDTKWTKDRMSEEAKMLLDMW